jgi:hypothetical protein
MSGHEPFAPAQDQLAVRVPLNMRLRRRSCEGRLRNPAIREHETIIRPCLAPSGQTKSARKQFKNAMA